MDPFFLYTGVPDICIDLVQSCSLSNPYLTFSKKNKKIKHLTLLSGVHSLVDKLRWVQNLKLFHVFVVASEG